MFDEERILTDTPAPTPAEENQQAGQPDDQAAGRTESPAVAAPDGQQAGQPEAMEDIEPKVAAAEPVAAGPAAMPAEPETPGSPVAAEAPPAQDDAAAATRAAEQEARKAFAAESGRQRQALFDRLNEALTSCHEALAEPGKTSLRALARHEREMHAVRDTIYQSKLTRRDWNQARQAYQAAAADLQQRKEQSSLAARGYIQSRADEIQVLLKAEGPNAALARLKEVQRERGQCLLSKADWDEVERILEVAYQQIREEGRRQSPWYRRMEAQSRQAHQFLGRLERQVAWLKSRIADSRRQWEVEGNALRAALLRQQFTDGEAELEQLTVKLADVRKQAEQLDARLQRKSPPESRTANPQSAPGQDGLDSRPEGS